MNQDDHQSGFSLAEALVAMALISIGAGALLAALNSATQTAVKRYEMLDLSLSAQYQLAALASVPLSDETSEEHVDDENRPWVRETQLVDRDEIRGGARLYLISVTYHSSDGLTAPQPTIETYVIR